MYALDWNNLMSIYSWEYADIHLQTWRHLRSVLNQIIPCQ